MLCILCLKAKDEIINMFDAHGLNLNVSNIVTAHFWLQPNEDNPNAKVICSICWNALESFHKFYKEVEQAHVALFAVLPAENLLRSGTSPSPNILKTYPDLFTASTKVEISEDYKADLTEYDVEKLDNPLKAVDDFNDKVQDIKSESESEIPLSNFIKSRKSPSVVENINRNRTLKKKKPKKEMATDDEETDEELFKQWPASTYAAETDHKIVCKHLDAVIESTLKLSCNICNVPLSGYTALRDHYRAAHNEFGYIACCDKKFDKRVALVDHLLFHKNPEYFKCEICDRNFANRKNLKAHLKGHDKKFIFHCDSCPKSFHQKLLLDRHKDTHILDRTFKCDECGKLYASKFTLGQHVYGVHKGGYTKVCDQCGKVFRDLETFRRHRVVHTDEPKPFVSCDKCGIKLANRSVLLKHMKYKHAETNVKQVCNICGNISSNIFALKRHVTYMHKYERKFKCSMCDKGFKTAIILKEHMSTHTGEVLYTCPHCPKTFNSNANMHSHRKKMHRKEWEENRRHPHMGAVANAE